jgi:hypothetical protein
MSLPDLEGAPMAYGPASTAHAIERFYRLRASGPKG